MAIELAKLQIVGWGGEEFKYSQLEWNVVRWRSENLKIDLSLIKHVREIFLAIGRLENSLLQCVIWVIIGHGWGVRGFLF